MVSGIVYVFLGFVIVIGHVQLSLLIMGPTGAFNYPFDFAGSWLKGV